MTPANPDTRQFTLEIREGGTAQASVIVENISDDSLTLQMYGADGTQSNQGTFALTTLSTEQKHIGKWVNFSQPEILLESRERKEVGFVVKVPEKTTPGVYSGGIAAESGASRKTGETQGNTISISSRIVVKLFVSVPGEKIHKYEWTDFSFKKSPNGGPGSFIVRYNNLGNTVVIADHEIKVTGFPGKSETFKLPTATILQGSSVEIPVKWENEPFFGFYTATATATFSEYDIISNGKKNPQTESREISVFIPLKTDTVEGKLIIALTAALILAVLALLAIIIKNILFKRKCSPYIVAQGETVASIAEKCKVNWKKLAKVNKLKAPYTVKPGQKIIAPQKKNEQAKK